MSCCVCVACVLHVRCMSRATQITSLNWGSGTSVAGTRILGGRREILDARAPPATLASTFVELSHIVDIHFWTMLMVALSIHFCGVVTGHASACFDDGCMCQKLMLSHRSVRVCMLKKNSKQKISPRYHIAKNMCIICLSKEVGKQSSELRKV